MNSQPNSFYNAVNSIYQDLPVIKKVKIPNKQFTSDYMNSFSVLSLQQIFVAVFFGLYDTVKKSWMFWFRCELCEMMTGRMRLKRDDMHIMEPDIKQKSTLWGTQMHMWHKFGHARRLNVMVAKTECLLYQGPNPSTVHPNSLLRTY